MEILTKGVFPLIAPLASSMGIQLSETSIKDNISNPNIQIKSLENFFKRFPDIDILFPIMDTSVEARAVGCPFEFKENVPVITEHRYKTIESIVRIPVPDPNKTPCMKLNIDVIRGLSKIKPKSIISYVIGPVTLAAHFMGITDLIKLAMREKDLFHNTLKHCNKIIKPYAEALVNAGASSLIILEPQVGIFSPKTYRESIRKHLEQLAYGLPNIILHVCGNTTPHLLDFAATDNIPGLSLDFLVDFETALLNNSPLKNKMLIGNIEPAGIMQKGTPEFVKGKVDILLKAMKGEKFILSTGCDLMPDTPLENLDSFIETGLKHR